jgi:hypothetical protein
LVVVEAGWRFVTRRPPGKRTEQLSAVGFIAVAIAAAGGLGILVGGGAPADSLHYVYAGIALVGLPLTATFTRARSPRVTAGLVFVVGLVLLVVLLRLFQTG